MGDDAASDAVNEVRAQYKHLLRETVRTLTAAARLRWPASPGAWQDRPVDWAEFVTLALAGATANVGGIEEILAGRSGSWEAAGVRQLLYSTVGEDEQYLVEHRTES